MASSSRKGRGPTDEELLLWQEVTRRDKKLKAPPNPPALPPKPPEAPKKAATLPPKVKKEALRELACGVYADVDGSTAKKLKRGGYPIDRTLDLHGMRRDEAYDTLREALEHGYHAGQRCLLVITGKGRARAGQGGEQGVLRGLVPQWLNEASLRPLVLAFDAAAARHGGQGALYVLVRRRRTKG